MLSQGRYISIWKRRKINTEIPPKRYLSQQQVHKVSALRVALVTAHVCYTHQEDRRISHVTERRVYNKRINLNKTARAKERLE